MVWKKGCAEDPEVGEQVGVRGALRDFGLLTVRGVDSPWYIFESASGNTFRLHRGALISMEEIMCERLRGEI